MGDQGIYVEYGLLLFGEEIDGYDVIGWNRVPRVALREDVEGLGSGGSIYDVSHEDLLPSILAKDRNAGCAIRFRGAIQGTPNVRHIGIAPFDYIVSPPEHLVN